MAQDEPIHVPLQFVATWDPEAGVYVASSDDIRGLVAEAPTLDELSRKVMGLIPDLMELNGSLVIERAVEDKSKNRPDREIPIQMLTNSRVTIQA